MRRLLAPLVILLLTFGTSIAFAPASEAYAGSTAATYADRWSNDRNPSYATLGDDCANFVSQAMHAGGFPYIGKSGSGTTDDSKWYMGPYAAGPGWVWSHSWTVVQDLRVFLDLHYPGGIQVGSAHTQAQQMAAYTPSGEVTGDVVFYDWNGDNHLDHASIQVGIGTDPDTHVYGNYIDQHTTDRKHAFWSLIQHNSQWPTTYITFYHIYAANS